jgi:NAD(P)-dependent dehydrogenase (short-subunit alcohol dehydrogenase family)
MGMGETVQAIEKLGRKAVALEGNVTQAADLTRAVAETEKALGPLGIAVNAAGIANAAAAEDMPLEQWQRMLDINLTGIFLSCQAQARAMLPRKRGAIVNIASMSGSIVNRGIQQIHYNTSKAGVVHLTKSLAMEWVDRGIRVNAISPGYTATPMNSRPEVAEQVKRFESETPMGRMARVDEMVGPAVFLASPAASFVTGVDLLVDGGFECW